MSSRSTKSYLEDSVRSSDAISGFLRGVSYAAYQTNLKTRSAVERQLQKLTEAAFRLGADAEKLCPKVDWRAVGGLGNVLRHEYDEIQDAVIWEAIHERLPLPRCAVQAVLATLPYSEQEP